MPIDFGADIDRRAYLKATGAITVGTAGLAGCVGQATGTLSTSVTDQPADIGDFESLIVTIEGIWLGPEGAQSGQGDPDDDTDADDGTADETDDGADDETDDGAADETNGDSTTDDETSGDDAVDADDDEEPSGREYHEFDEPQTADLVELQGDETQLIDEREIDVGAYRFLQLNVSETEGVLVDGGEAPVELPGNAPLTFNASFEIREDTRTSFLADFAPVRRGQTDTYLLRPVPRGIEVTYEESDDG